MEHQLLESRWHCRDPGWVDWSKFRDKGPLPTKIWGLQCIEPRHLTEICRDLANHPQVDHGTLKPSCGWENPDLTSGYLTKDKRLPVLEISDSFFSNTLHHQHIRFKFFFHFSSIFFTAFFSIIKMKSVLSLVAFAAAALAQNVAIGLPTAGQKVTAGDDLIVQIQRPVC